MYVPVVGVWYGAARAAVLVGHRVWSLPIPVASTYLHPMRPPALCYPTDTPTRSSLLFEPHLIQSSRVLPFRTVWYYLSINVLPKFRALVGQSPFTSWWVCESDQCFPILSFHNHRYNHILKARNGCKSQKPKETKSLIKEWKAET